MATAPPGFYDDGRGAMRWWDGAKWTHDVRTADADDTTARIRTSTGAAARPGAFVPERPPKKGKPWVLWVVIGAVVISAAIVAGAVLIPNLLGGVEDGKADAEVAVELYDEAWRTADCDKYQEATTEGLRSRLELADCAAFVAASEGFIASFQDYTLEIQSVEQVDDQVSVRTSETYTSGVDGDGNVLDPPVEFVDRYRYVVVPYEDGWAINETLDDPLEDEQE